MNSSAQMLIPLPEDTASAGVMQRFQCAIQPGTALPLYEGKIPAGFPSPAEDHIEATLSTDDYLIRNKTATFFAEVKGDSMIDAGIFEGDMLVVDRSMKPQIGHVVVAELDGEFTVKFLGKQQLLPANPKYKPIKFRDGQTVAIVGVVVATMRKLL